MAGAGGIDRVACCPAAGELGGGHDSAYLEDRMLPADVYGTAERCNSTAGETALRGFIAHFDPRLASRMKIDVVQSPSLVLTALPDERLVVSNTVLRDVQPDALAALLTHQIAHLQHGDVVEAMFRARGPVETYGRMLFGSDRETQGPLLKFTEAQEEQADEAALGMLVAYGISPRGGADLFADLDFWRRTCQEFRIGTPLNASPLALQSGGLAPIGQDEPGPSSGIQ